MKEIEISIESSFKKAKIDAEKKDRLNIKNIYKFSNTFLLMIIMSILIFLCYLKSSKNYNKNFKYDVNFKYEDYAQEIITDKIKKDSGWIIGLQEAQFINGIIRKNRLKNCLEIGVAHGGSSILILNSIKDFKNSVLVSLDLNKELYNDPNKLTGYRVKEYFPELTKNWKLYTGQQAHKFLVNLNIKFDFLFLDSTHATPGEILNFIEALPFLNENAIVVIHDLLWHFRKVINSKFFPACISLIPTLYGDKIFIRNKSVSNIGAAFLYKNQEKHYLDYFLLLLNFWEYIPTDEQLNDLRDFIKKYYKDEIYINIFELAVRLNKNANQKFQKNNNISEEKKYLVSLGNKWNITNNENLKEIKK